MRILVLVGSDLSENRKTSKEYGFLGTINQPRVSLHLSHTLTECDDGEQVNIPVLDFFAKFLNRFRISGMPRGIGNKNLMDCNEEKFENCSKSAESKSQ